MCSKSSDMTLSVPDVSVCVCLSVAVSVSLRKHFFTLFDVSTAANIINSDWFANTIQYFLKERIDKKDWQEAIQSLPLNMKDYSHQLWLHPYQK